MHHSNMKKVTDILNGEQKEFNKQFEYLCENYGRQFAIDYFSQKLNEDDAVQQNQNNQNQQDQQQSQQTQQNEPDQKALEEVKQGMVNNFKRVKDTVALFMKTYSGLCEDQMNGVITALGEVDKEIGSMDLNNFTELAKKKAEQDKAKQQPQQQNQQQPQQQDQQNQQQKDQADEQKDVDAITKHGLNKIFDSLNENEEDGINPLIIRNAANAALETLHKKGKDNLANSCARIIQSGAEAGRKALLAAICVVTMLSICPSVVSAKEIKARPYTPAVQHRTENTDKAIAYKMLARTLVDQGFGGVVLKTIGMAENADPNKSLSDAVQQYKENGGEGKYNYTVCQYATKDGTIIYVTMVYPTKVPKDAERNTVSQSIENNRKNPAAPWSNIK